MTHVAAHLMRDSLSSALPSATSGSPVSTRSFGAQVIAPGRTRFRLWAPDVKTVSVELETGRSFPMRRLEDGWHEVEVPCVAGTRYQFKVRPGVLVPDPASRLQAGDLRDASVVVDPDSYVWRNTAWRGRPWHETVLYELHAGAMGGFRGILARLPELAALGVTAIELMPIADFPGKHNWGYDGVLLYAPETTYGAPEVLKALIDGAHDLGIQVFLDVVYNHFGPDGNFLNQYASRFFSEDQKNAWGSSIDYRQPAVREFFIENAIYWLEEYRFDGLRFDAVHAIPDASFMSELGARVRKHFDPARHIHLVLEHDGNAAHYLREQFDAQWNDDLHHVLHVMLTGETRGYYSAYAEATTEKLARCLKEGFAYQGEVSPAHHGDTRGEPSADLPPTAFIAFLQNHDQIGNRAHGDRLTTMADSRAIRAAATLILLSPQIPMLFMGEEWGSTKPFNYFVNHEGELAEAIRLGRLQEFALAADPDDDQRVIPDPSEMSTYHSSIPDHPSGVEVEYAQWLEFYREVLAARHASIVPRLQGASSLGAVVIGNKAVKAMWRLGDGAVLTLYTNLSEDRAMLNPEHWPDDSEELLETRVNAVSLLRQGCLRAFTTVALLKTRQRL
ncbi:MAG: treZ [Rhodocyclales bacterium]|nr:treZ [Rhodocyclales bacterium]